MSQLYDSASSKCLIFYLIISVLTCQAMARHRFNHNNLLREKEKREKTLENIIKNFPKEIGLLFLRPSSIKQHGSEEVNQEISPLDDDAKINTSCGHINCEDVPNYPLKLIKDLFEEQTPIIPHEVMPMYVDYEYAEKSENSYEADEDEESEITRAAVTTPLGRSYNPSSWRNPTDENNIPTNLQECQRLADVFRVEQEEKFNEEITRNNNEICRYKLKETKPKETIDRKNQPSTLVNDDGISIVIKGYECTAGLDCYDRAGPLHYKYHCKTHWEYRNFCTLNDDGTTIIQKKVAIADGCNCIPVKIE